MTSFAHKNTNLFADWVTFPISFKIQRRNLKTKEFCEKGAYYLWRQLNVWLIFPTDGTKYKSALGSPDHHMGEQSSLTEAAVVSYQRETAGLVSLIQ